MLYISLNRFIGIRKGGKRNQRKNHGIYWWIRIKEKRMWRRWGCKPLEGNINCRKWINQNVFLIILEGLWVLWIKLKHVEKLNQVFKLLRKYYEPCMSSLSDSHWRIQDLDSHDSRWSDGVLDGSWQKMNEQRTEEVWETRWSFKMEGDPIRNKADCSKSREEEGGCGSLI